MSLTTGVDAVTGGAGNDSFVGQIDATATLNTLGLLDVIDGGAGTDTLTVINTTVNSVSTALTAASVTNIENFVYMATAGGDLDFDDAGSATNFSMTVLGASDFADVRTTDTVTIVNGGAAMDSTYTYNGTGVANAADAHTIAFTSVTAGAELTFVGDVETMTLDVNGASSFAVLEFDADTTALNIDAAAALTVATTLTAAGVTTYTVTGAGAVKLTPALGTATTAYNAAESTGAQTILAGASNITITTGTADDVVDMGATLTSSDVINLGAGSDTLRVDVEGLTAGSSDLSISNVETLRFDGINTDGAIQMDNLAIATIRFDDATAANLDGGIITLTDIATSSTAFVYRGGAVLDDDLFFSPVTIDYDTTTAIAAMTITIDNGGKVADEMLVGAITAANVTAITINASEIGQATADALTITGVVANNATDLTLVADGKVVFSGIDGDILDTIDFSGADSGVTAQLDDAAAAVTVTLGDGNDTFVATTGSGVITIDLGAGNDAYTSSTSVDIITTGTGVDTVTLVGNATDALNVIKDFTAGAGGDVMAGLTAASDGATADADVDLTDFHTLVGGADTLTGGINVVIVNVSALTKAGLVARAADMNGDGTANDALTFEDNEVGNIAYVLASDGTNTGLFLVDNSSNSTTDTDVDTDDTITLLATFEGISDVTTLDASNFANFL